MSYSTVWKLFKWIILVVVVGWAFWYASSLIFQNEEVVSETLSYIPLKGSPTVKIPQSIAKDWGFRWSKGYDSFIDCADLDDNLTVTRRWASGGNLSIDYCDSDIQVIPHFDGSCSLTNEEKAYFNMTKARAIGIICGPKDIMFFSRGNTARHVHTEILEG